MATRPSSQRADNPWPDLTTAYSPYKAAHHLDRVRTLREGRRCSPVLVQLSLSDTCNQSCSFCAFRSKASPNCQLFGEPGKNPARRVPDDRVLRLLNECRELGIRAVEFAGAGEPTLHPLHTAAFRATVEHGLDLALVTNGTRLTPEARQALRFAKWIRVSLNAGTADTYARVHGSPVRVFRKVQQNVLGLAWSGCTVGISFIVLRENWREVLPAARLAKQLGVSSIRFGAVFTNEGADYYRNFLSDATGECRKAEAYDEPGFRVLNRFEPRVRDLLQQSPDYRACLRPLFTLFIGADLNVYRCCALAYNRRGILGSIEKRSLSEMWLADETWDAIHNFDARRCPRCPFNDQNRFLSYLLDQSPCHANFV